MAIKQAFVLLVEREITAQELHGCLDDSLGNKFCDGVAELKDWDNDDVVCCTKCEPKEIEIIEEKIPLGTKYCHYCEKEIDRNIEPEHFIDGVYECVEETALYEPAEKMKKICPHCNYYKEQDEKVCPNCKKHDEVSQ